MKNLIVSLLLAVSLSAPVVINAGDTCAMPSVQVCADWYEFVLVGEQWYKIIHHDDGSETVIAVAGPVYD